MAVEKRQYEMSFKQEALRLLELSGKSVRQIEDDLGITPGLLNKWKKRYQLHPATGNVKPSEQHDMEAENRRARRARINAVAGKGKSQRDVFLSQDARQSLADYLEKEHSQDAVGLENPPLFLSAATVLPRQPDGRLTPRSVNYILEQIGRWHDAEMGDEDRHISPLRPHDLRHTFAFHLSKVTGADAYELERRLGHRSQRYTNPPEDVAAAYIEEF